MELLADLCGRVVTPEQTMSRPSKPLSDMVYACALKVYSGFSLRRFESLMEVAQEWGHIRETCNYSTVSKYMKKPEVAAILHALIAISSAPLSVVETSFAVDSSGFSALSSQRASCSWFGCSWRPRNYSARSSSRIQLSVGPRRAPRAP